MPPCCSTSSAWGPRSGDEVPMPATGSAGMLLRPGKALAAQLPGFAPAGPGTAACAPEYCIRVPFRSNTWPRGAVGAPQD